MAVPNVSTFSFWDVADEIYGYVGGGMSLEILFEDANASGFVTAYAGAKDRLSNFRGYSQGGSQYPPSLTTFRSSPDPAVSGDGATPCDGLLANHDNFWHNGSSTGPSVGDAVYGSDQVTLITNRSLKYYPTNFVEVDAVYLVNGNGIVTYRANC
tara:strand:+ start:364 stop:828 length:465 start_codon:yes stop_codon:yes gene_type:complete